MTQHEPRTEDLDELRNTDGFVGDLGEDSPQSPMEALRARREENAARREVFIPMTGYEDLDLHCKYRLLERHETDEIGKRVRKNNRQASQGEFMFLVLMDTIIAACEGFYLGKDDKAEPLMNEDKSRHISSYLQFATEMNGDPPPTHRQAVQYVFGDNDFTAGQHGLLLNRWLGNTGINVDEEALGE